MVFAILLLVSYDLFFKKKNGKDFLLNEFEDYFSSRPHYKVEGVQAHYENKNTGVYFLMEYNDVKEVIDTSETTSEDWQVSLNLNFVRPHIFATETEPEVHSFVKHFKLLIKDIQNDGNPTDIYTTEDFIRGWNIGNKFSYDSIGKSNPEIRKRVLPAADIERYWQWNYKRIILQDSLKEDIFVPKISFHISNGDVKSFIVWSDAVPTLFPVVDTVVVFRQSLRPTSGFSKKQSDFTIVEYSKIIPLLGDEQISDSNLKYRTLLSADDAVKYVSSLPASDEQPNPIAMDSVLDKELMP